MFSNNQPTTAHIILVAFFAIIFSISAFAAITTHFNSEISPKKYETILNLRSKMKFYIDDGSAHFEELNHLNLQSLNVSAFHRKNSKNIQYQEIFNRYTRKAKEYAADSYITYKEYYNLKSVYRDFTNKIEEDFKIALSNQIINEV